MGTASLAYELQPKQSSRAKGKGKTTAEKKVTLGVVERRRLLQLLVCLMLFISLFVGKGLLSAQMEGISQLLASDIQVMTLVEDVREAVDQGYSLSSILKQLGSHLFFGNEGIMLQVSYPQRIENLTQLDGDANLLAQHLGIALPVAMDVEMEGEALTFVEAEVAEVELDEGTQLVAEEPLIIPMAYDGIELPNNVSMDYYNLSLLGVEEMTVPVIGELSSPFGWRIHPIYGELAFHYGTDIAADTGDAIFAFASGTVDYIGESDDYGLYLQIDHGNGVTSFYAHCSELLVQAGQKVAVGDVVALVGSTGVSTGPHLHFELKVDGIYLNGLYYLEEMSVYA